MGYGFCYLYRLEQRNKQRAEIKFDFEEVKSGAEGEEEVNRLT